jgi:hypothetical protein
VDVLSLQLLILTGHYQCLLYVSLVSKGNIEEDLFKSNGPLSSFSFRIKMAYYLGKISHSVRRDLDTIRSIRNDFAHHPEYLDFDVQKVRDRCSNLVNVWCGSDARPRAKFTAAVSGLLAMIHAETFQTESPDEKPDAPVLEEHKLKIRTMSKEAADALTRALSRDAIDEDT